jgi:hypothetical protein
MRELMVPPNTLRGLLVREGAHLQLRSVRCSVVVALMASLVLFFSVFRFVPSFAWTLDLIVAVTVIGSIVIGYRNVPITMRYTRIYIIVFVVLIPLWGALMAKLVFEQPAWMGLAAQRAILLVPFSLVLVSLLMRRRLFLREVKVSLVALAWINLAGCVFILWFFNADDYSKEQLGALLVDAGAGRNQFILPMPFIVFGAIYYYARGVIYNKFSSRLTGLPFFIYILVGASGTGRILIASLFVSFLCISLIGHRRNILREAGGFAVIVIILWLFFSVALPDRAGLIASKYADAVSAVIGDDSVEDYSASARVVQAGVAMAALERNILLGTGTISNRWNEGYQGMFGYFHPSDLGLLGVVFNYGILGLLFFTVQYGLAWKSVRRFSRKEFSKHEHVFLLSCCGCLITMLASSITTGSIAYSAEQVFFYLLLLQAGTSIYGRSHQILSD